MLLYMGGYLAGQLYQCPNCQYVGPVVLENETDTNEKQIQQYSLSMSRVNNTLNHVGLFFGLAFMIIGALVVFSPFTLNGGPIVTNYGIGLLILGGALTAMSAVFSWVERPRPIESP